MTSTITSSEPVAQSALDRGPASGPTAPSRRRRSIARLSATAALVMAIAALALPSPAGAAVHSPGLATGHFAVQCDVDYDWAVVGVNMTGEVGWNWRWQPVEALVEAYVWTGTSWRFVKNSGWMRGYAGEGQYEAVSFQTSTVMSLPGQKYYKFKAIYRWYQGKGGTYSSGARAGRFAHAGTYTWAGEWSAGYCNT